MLHKVKTLFKFIVIMCDPYVVIYFNPLFHSGKKILLQGRSFHPSQELNNEAVAIRMISAFELLVPSHFLCLNPWPQPGNRNNPLLNQPTLVP
jgi:hypothetical protein